MNTTVVISKTWERPMLHPGWSTRAVGLAVCLASLGAVTPAAAQQFVLHAEPAAAFWLDQQQSDRFTPGFYFAVRPGIMVGPVLSLQASYEMLLISAGENYSENGAAHMVTGGVRVKPFATLGPEEDQLGGLFADFNAGYVRTGDLDRFGFNTGLGYNFQATPWMAVGPVVRYGQVVQPDDNMTQVPDDAQFLTAGLNLSFGPAYKEKVAAAECPACPECRQKPQQRCPEVVAAPTPCPDRDRDGVCDSVDQCPTEIGPPATFGCPIEPCSGKPLRVMVQFEWDSSAMPSPQDDNPQSMDPVLDAVARAIDKDPSCRVCIVGYASEEGGNQYNQDLSVRRSTAVQGYLAARGLAKSRMPSTGLGERCQIEPLTSLELNRRVEFHRLETDQACPTDCSR